MIVRKTTPGDFRQLKEIYAYARIQMKQCGNPSQWGDDRPSESVLAEDIRKGESYLLETEQNGLVCGAFTFIIGNDPTYRTIEDGHWLNEDPYGTIHRIAGNGRAGNLFGECLSFCMSQIPNIRIDTHEDNLIMRHLLEKNHFVKCGIIYVEDGSPRIAYQKCGY